jgi:hypothetical protein
MLETAGMGIIRIGTRGSPLALDVQSRHLIEQNRLLKGGICYGGKFYTGAPRQLRQSVERCKIVKRA